MPGTGKDLLQEVLLGVGLDHNYTALGPPKNDSYEFRKDVTTALAAGSQAIVWGNVSFLNSADLSDLITLQLWTQRILGGNQTLRVDPLQLIWISTGNNVSFSREMRRRTIVSRMDAEDCPRTPEDRSGFKHDPLRD